MTEKTLVVSFVQALTLAIIKFIFRLTVYLPKYERKKFRRHGDVIGREGGKGKLFFKRKDCQASKQKQNS